MNRGSGPFGPNALCYLETDYAYEGRMFKHESWPVVSGRRTEFPTNGDM